jgi:hypothetical protein
MGVATRNAEQYSSAPKDVRQEEYAQIGVERLFDLLFVLEALFTRGSRAQLCAVCSLPKTVCCHWLLCLSNQFLLAPTEIKPFYYSIHATMWALGKILFVNLSSYTFS